MTTAINMPSRTTVLARGQLHHSGLESIKSINVNAVVHRHAEL